MLILPLWTAGVFVALGDLLDYLDGALARAQGSASREGAIFDAVLDRYIDFLVIGALTYLTAVILNPQRDLFIEKMTFMTSETALLLGMAALLGVGADSVHSGKNRGRRKKIDTHDWRPRLA